MSSYSVKGRDRDGNTVTNSYFVNSRKIARQNFREEHPEYQIVRVFLTRYNSRMYRRYYHYLPIDD